ncbi:cold shock domain-containing protein [Lentzea sp. NPDC003310]|uniref:cold shock domain-containing protein n=1 Tax=Lentzea sp. NPDC003310 TaxID=3154447 RepID=UPI0033B2058A
MTRGQVVRWDDEEGWGVIESAGFDGPVWTHFSAVEAPDGGFRRLRVGGSVEVEAERADQDGYRWRATRVRAED